MPLLHDQAVRSRIEGRLGALTPDRRPLWGKMSVDQMLWHLNEALSGALGEIDVAPPDKKPPIPGLVDEVPLHQRAVCKGAPRCPSFVAKRQYDFDAERTRSLRLAASARQQADRKRVAPQSPVRRRDGPRRQPPARETLRPPPQAIRRVA